MSTIEAVKQLLLQSGTSWILWLLGGLSFVGALITVERWFFYRARGTDLEATARALDAHLAAAQRAQAIEALIASGSTAADRAMQSAAALERTRLERWLAYLGTVGNNAPFIGLFGTVVGVIGAFEELGHGAPGHGAGGGAAAAAQVASQAVMASIAEALVATAVGIFVALPAVAAYNYFQRRIATLLGGAEVLSQLVLAYLSERPPREEP